VPGSTEAGGPAGRREAAKAAGPAESASAAGPAESASAADPAESASAADPSGSANTADPSLSSTPTAIGLDPRLEAAGLNLACVLSPDRYNARVAPSWRAAELLPRARSVVLLCSGGPAFFRAFRRAGGPADPGDGDPLDDFTRRVVEDASHTLESEGFAARPFFYWEQRGGRFADFVALGQAGGLGGPSRLGVLLHPHYGPWLALRAVLLTERPLPPTRGPAPEGYAPCAGCPAPCAAACHGAAVAAERFDVAACASARQTLPACTARCDARRACVVGPEHAYEADAEAFFASAVLRAISRAS